MKSLQFLESHLTIRTDTRQLGKVSQVLVEEANDASSVRSSSLPRALVKPARLKPAPVTSRTAGAPGPKHRAPQPRGLMKPSCR